VQKLGFSLEPHVRCIESGTHNGLSTKAGQIKICDPESQTGEPSQHQSWKKTGDLQVLETNGTFETCFIINPAGLHSDRIANQGQVNPQLRSSLPSENEPKPENRHLSKP